MKKLFLILLLVTASGCTIPHKTLSPAEEKIQRYDLLFKSHPEYVANTFDYPIQHKEWYGFYMSQSFGNLHSLIKRYHVAEDWIGNLGSPVYAIGNGFVRFVGDLGYGWGNVVIVVHRLKENDQYRYVEAFYAHIDKVTVSEYSLIKRGDEIGTIGTAGGAWIPHLHFELRSELDLMSHGYEDTTTGYLEPTLFIGARRYSSPQ